MSPDAIYTPNTLRALADEQPSPFKPHLMDEYRKALRWAANVIEASDAVIEESKARSIISIDMSEDELLSLAYDVGAMPEQMTQAALFRFARAVLIQAAQTPPKSFKALYDKLEETPEYEAIKASVARGETEFPSTPDSQGAPDTEMMTDAVETLRDEGWTWDIDSRGWLRPFPPDGAQAAWQEDVS